NEEWDVDGLLAEVRMTWPSQLTVEQLGEATSTNEVYELLMDEALGHYEAREQQFTPEVMRQIERAGMLQLIDQRWRAHLFEMDYLRAGIGLRGMGQRDPLVEWQREGFDMFGQMMHGIWRDFVRWRVHATVTAQPAEAPAEEVPARAAAAREAQVRDVTYSSPDDPSSSGGAASMAA